MWGNKAAASVGLLGSGFVRNVIGPLALMSITPLVAVLFVYANTHLDGSLALLMKKLYENPSNLINTAFTVKGYTAGKILATFAIFELLVMRFMPGGEFRGPVSPGGNVPVYKANGFQSYIFTIFTYLFSAYYLKLFNPSIIYDHYQEMIVIMCFFSFGFCAFLYVKGLYFPSSSDNGSNGNPVLDFYWGTELYPRIFGWDVKQFTNCRFGMMAWPLLPLAFAHKSLELHGVLSFAMIVNVSLQLVYVSKFFLWETGYLASIDIMHDRAGYYICWGCLVWVPVSVFLCPL